MQCDGILGATPNPAELAMTHPTHRPLQPGVPLSCIGSEAAPNRT